MSQNEFIYPFVMYSIPAVSALVCLGMFLFYNKQQDKPVDNRITLTITGYFITVVINWSSIITAIYWPDVFIWILGLRYASFSLTQVFFYKFIYEVTCLPGNKPFSKLHFLLPVLLGVVLQIWAFSIPHNICLEVIITLGVPLEGYEAFSRFAFSHHQIRFMYGIVYTILALIRLRNYRREIVHYSSQLYEGRLGWLNLLIFLSVILLIAPTLPMIFDKPTLIHMRFVYVPVFCLVVQHILLLYNILAGNFVVFAQVEPKAEAVHLQQSPKEIPYITRKKEFEKYLSEEKPYMKTDLKIMEMAADLGINRTYLSGFINQYYGMNFSTFINECRLKELNELRKDPANISKTNLEIIQIAGFGSYQSYLRAKKRHDAQSLLSPEK